jgi:hypothetical protein
VKPYAGSDFEELRGKKEQEKLLVSRALSRLGFTRFELTPHERPDALVDFRDTSGLVRLGCEIQTLQSDAAASGSQLREFESRWIRVARRVLEALRSDGVAVPYCTVWFRNPSYASLRQLADDDLVTELVVAGRRLRGGYALTFPQSDTPTLNSILIEIRVVDPHGEGFLWWPTYLKSGEVPSLDDTIVNAVRAKGTLATSFDWRGSEDRWLLLVAEASRLTDVIGGAREIDLPGDLASPFTLVLVWDRFSEDIWTVFPHHAVICDGTRQVLRSHLLPERLRRFCRGGEDYPTKPKAM